MNMNSGFKNRRLFSQTAEMQKTGRYTTRPNHLTIPNVKKKLPNTASRKWTKTASKESESVKARERNIFGRRSRFLRTTGTITARLRSGDPLGQNTVTGILQKTSRSITEVMQGRVRIRYRRSTKALLQDRWKPKANLLTDVRSTGRSGNGTP